LPQTDLTQEFHAIDNAGAIFTFHPHGIGFMSAGSDENRIESLFE